MPETNEPLLSDTGLPRHTVTDFLQYTERGWRLLLEDGGAICPEQMETVRRTKDGDCLLATWQGHPDYGASFSVETRWEKTEDGRFAGRLCFRGYQGEKPVAIIEFPKVSIPIDEDTQLLHAAFDLGLLYPQTAFPPGADVIKNVEGMQFGAILRPGKHSLYFDYRDPARTIKEYRLTVDSQHLLTVSGRYFCPLPETLASRGEIPYDSSIVFFVGGWYEAARIYRVWALNQPWHTNRRNRRNPLADIDLWVWNRGLIKDVIPPVERLHRDCPEVKLALDWYWWHSNPYDTDYPFFWPPREGEEAFTKAVRRLNHQGIFSQVYVNGVCWDMDADTWSLGGDKDVVRHADGSPYAYAFNQYNHHRLAYMCGEAPHHHDQMAELMDKLEATGLSGQYLDMIGNATYSPCYNPAHKHAKGGGNYVIEGYRKLLKRIRDRHPDYPLSTEAAQEAYMDLVDSSIVCSMVSAERMGRFDHDPVPAFVAVYHGSMALYGSYALPDGIPPWDPKWPDDDRWPEEKPWHRLYPDQFFVELARTIVWGVQPMVCNLKDYIADDPAFKDVYQFILDTARFYHQHRNFLYSGEMLSPEGFQCDQKEVSFFYRMIFTKQDQASSVTKKLPVILHGHWRDPEGREALILANYTADEHAWTYGGRQGTLAAHSYDCVDL